MANRRKQGDNERGRRGDADFGVFLVLAGIEGSRAAEIMETL